MSTIRLNVNGTTHRLDIPEQMPLLWALRDHLGLMGTKYGCGIGACGACTVHIAGRAVRSCLLPVGNIGEQHITTIEGLSSANQHPVQRAWREHRVPQCGYCQSGQIMTAAALLAETPEPTREDIRTAMSGNLCRCGTYSRIEAAVASAAELARNSDA